VQGTVTSIDQGSLYTVSYTDKQGAPQVGQGPVASGTEQPQVGDEVSVYYSTSDPSQIVILNIPGGGLVGIAGGLRMAGYVCLAVGGILLLAGIIGLIAGRRKAVPPARAYPASLPPGQPYPGQPYPGQPYPGQPGPPPPGYPQQPPGTQPYPPQPGYPQQPGPPPPGYPQQ
jgi:hypothetical protein